MDEISKALGEMTAEVRNVGSRLDRLEATVSGHNQAIEMRVRRLELWRSWLAGAGAAMGVVLGWLVSLKGS